MAASPPDAREWQVVDHVFDLADRQPDKTAIVYNGRRFSYAALAHHIAIARGYFVRRGIVGPGTAVLVCNILHFWFFSLALRSLGLTTLAIPSVEIIDDLGLLDVRCVVTSATDATRPGIRELCAARTLELLTVSMAGEAPMALDAWTPPGGPGGHILLTSATTGVPKKVLLDPSFEPGFIDLQLRPGIFTRDTICNLFDFPGWTGGGYKTTAALFVLGATVVIDQGPDRFRGMLYPGVTHSMIVPSMIDSLLTAPPGTLAASDKMRLSVTGGPMTQRQIDLIRTHITPNLYNSFGCTETRTLASTLIQSPDDYRWHQVKPDVGVEIVDEFDRPVATGEIGRLRVSTAGGPSGYLHDEAATKAFFKDGFFYSGDLASFREDGRMALHGRFTDVINISGHKILPAPIENQLRDDLGVSGVCLFFMQDSRGEEEIHVVIEAAAAVAVDGLTEALRHELWRYPRARVHYVSALPRNAMGKVLRPAAREQALAEATRPGPAGGLVVPLAAGEGPGEATN